MQKKLRVNPDKAQFDNEIAEQMQFGMALAGLLAETEQTESSNPTKTALTAPIDPTQAKMIFRREEMNFTRGFRRAGWFIDLNGNVYGYEYKLAEDGQPGMKLEFKTPPIFITRVAPELIGEKLALSRKAAQGKFTRENAANDTGSEIYSTFLVNPLTNKFEEIKLKETGDFAGTNKAPEAALLVEWLETIFNRAAETQSSTNKTPARSEVNLPDASTGELPSDGELQILLQKTIQDLADAIEAEDFTEFQANNISKGATAYRVTPERIKLFYGHKYIVPYLRRTTGKMPTFSQKAIGKFTLYKPDKSIIVFTALNLNGIYEDGNTPVEFEVQYLAEGKDWKISVFNFHTSVKN